jgi:hypothetical protein
VEHVLDIAGRLEQRVGIAGQEPGDHRLAERSVPAVTRNRRLRSEDIGVSRDEVGAMTTLGVSPGKS